MSYYHSDEKGYIRDKYDNYKDAAEVKKAVRNGDLRPYSNGKYVYDPITGEEFWSDGTKR